MALIRAYMRQESITISTKLLWEACIPCATEGFNICPIQQKPKNFFLLAIKLNIAWLFRIENFLTAERHNKTFNVT